MAFVDANGHALVGDTPFHIDVEALDTDMAMTVDSTTEALVVNEMLELFRLNRSISHSGQDFCRGATAIGPLSMHLVKGCIEV